MKAADRLEQIFARALDIAKTLQPQVDAYIEGPPPGASVPNAQQHRAWFEQQVKLNVAKYPPQWYETPHGLVYESLWLLTRPYVQGWDAEIRRYERETGHYGRDGVVG